MRIVIELPNHEVKDLTVNEGLGSLLRHALDNFIHSRTPAEDYVKRNYYDYSAEGQERKLADVLRRIEVARLISEHAFIKTEER